MWRVPVEETSTSVLSSRPNLPNLIADTQSSFYIEMQISYLVRFRIWGVLKAPIRIWFEQFIRFRVKFCLVNCRIRNTRIHNPGVRINIFNLYIKKICAAKLLVYLEVVDNILVVVDNDVVGGEGHRHQRQATGWKFRNYFETFPEQLQFKTKIYS